MKPRPEWKCPYSKITYEEAAWLDAYGVYKIEYKWKWTSADTTEDWLEFHSNNGGMRLFSTHIVDGYYVKFAPGSRSLVRLESSIVDQLRAIQAWEIENQHKLQQYHKLKEELGL